MGESSRRAGFGRLAAVAGLLVAGTTAAGALEVVLNDVAADRVERQRHFARGELPLAGTPELGKLEARLGGLGLAKGRAIYVRVFKAESELELWMQNGSGTFSMLAVYPVCHWTGTLGPKLKEGDRQSPEGFYSVGVRQTRLVGRWRRAFNVGFPNSHDQLLGRTGSYILIHGGCSSVGCFAMTDPVQEEIYALANAALANGQERFQIHIFPFRMTAENLARHADHDWAHTWADLKPAYDSFERTRVPPRIALCGVRYKVADGLAGETGRMDARLPVLRPASNLPAAADANAVLDSNGNWQAPACELDEEERRKGSVAATLAPPEPSSLTTATIDRVDTSPPAPGARPAGKAAQADATDNRQRSRRQAAHPARGGRPAAPRSGHASRDDLVPAGEGFGSVTFRRKDRLAVHGG